MLKSKLFKTIIGQFLIVAGLATVYFGIIDIRKSHRSIYWPKVKGRIVDSTIIKRMGKGQTVYEPKIVYQYQAVSIPLVSNKVRINPILSSDRSEIQEIVQFYPVGKSVDVYYKPKHPQTAVLEPATQLNGNLILISGLVLLGLGTISFMIKKK